MDPVGDDLDLVAPVVRPKPPRRAVWLVGIAIGVLVVANNVGNIFTTTLAEDHPAVLLALNSSNRSLALTTNQLDWWSYYGLGMMRLLVADPLFFLLGTWYGDAGLRWVERRLPSQAETVRILERGFEKASYVLVAFAPNNPICLLAGASGMRLRWFLVCNVAGTVARLALIAWVGDVFSDAIEDVLGFFADYRIPLLIASAVIFGGFFAYDLIKGGGDINVVKQLEEESERDG